MHVTAAVQLACPIDGGALERAAEALRCANGHNFDRAREGYWNLLVVQHKASLDPGDTKDMVAARRRILDAGHFAPAAAQVFDVTREIATRRDPAELKPLRIIDAACGEGYYLDRIAAAARNSSDPTWLELGGIDVSKWAIRAAARRNDTDIAWIVANNRRMPFMSGTVDVILSIFGFAVWEGFKPAQMNGGHVLLVDPGPDHLIELRSIIYPTVKRAGPPSLQAAMAAGYRVVGQSQLTYPIRLASRAEIGDLMAMTPHAYRIASDRRAALETVDHLDVTVDLAFRLLRLETD